MVRIFTKILLLISIFPSVPVAFQLSDDQSTELTMKDEMRQLQNAILGIKKLGSDTLSQEIMLFITQEMKNKEEMALLL